MISNGKREINSTIKLYPVPKNDSANKRRTCLVWLSQANLESSMKHLGFSPFIRER